MHGGSVYCSNALSIVCPGCVGTICLFYRNERQLKLIGSKDSLLYYMYSHCYGLSIVLHHVPIVCIQARKRYQVCCVDHV